VKRATPYALLAPGLVLLSLLFGIPAIYNLWLAFHTVTPYDAAGEGVWAGFSNFVTVLTDPAILLSLRNTALWQTLLTVVARIVLGLGIALLLQARVLRRLHILGVLRVGVLVPWMVPPTVAVAAWQWLLDGQNGLFNRLLLRAGITDDVIPFLADVRTAWWSVATIITWRELPFVIIVLMAALQAVPGEQYEAAALDGAGAIKSFWHVTLPSIRPVLSIAALMITIGTFNNFIYVWLSTGGGPGTFTQVLATQLYTAAFIDNSLGVGAAIGLLMTACMIIFAAIYLGLTRREGQSR
jgi:multiple sugar transport system permease protein